MAKTRDMTVGSPIKLIFGFFLPLLFGLLFQQLYNAVDTVVVGRFLGVNALAGVGRDRRAEFPDSGFLHRHLRRVCHPGSTKIRRT